MPLTVKPAFLGRIIAFNGSAGPLGERSQDDLKLLLILAYTSNRADYVAMFQSPPTLAELLGGTPGAGGAELSAETLKALFSDNGNVRALQDGDQLALWLNAILDATGGLATFNFLQGNYVSTAQHNAAIAFLQNQITAGAAFNPATMPGLLDWWKGNAGFTKDGTGGVTEWTGAKGNSFIWDPLGPALPPTEVGGKIIFAGAQGLILPALNIGANTTDLAVFAVLESTQTTFGMVLELSANSFATGDAFAIFQNSVTGPPAIDFATYGGGNSGVYDLRSAPIPQSTLVKMRGTSYRSVQENALYVDGTAAPYTQPATILTPFLNNQALYLGSREGRQLYGSFKIKDLLIFKQQVSTQDVAALESFL